MKTIFNIKSLLILLLGAFSLVARAQDISVQQAEDYARKFFQQTPAVKSSQVDLTFAWDGENLQTKSTAGNAPAFYVFNRGENEGFVIIAGNKAVSPVLAYAYEGKFVTKDMPDNVRFWMQQLKEGVRYQIAHPTKATNNEWNQVKAASVVKELETQNWNQSDRGAYGTSGYDATYYNKHCPEINGKHCLTGCGITAAAIIMAYHQWPDCGEGTLPGYVTRTEGLHLKPITLGQTYDWKEMNNSSEKVSMLMWHLGVMAQADYGIGATGATINAFELNLPIYMKYDPDMRFKERENYDLTTWQNMLRAEIDDNRPVFYQGFEKKSEEKNGQVIEVPGSGHAYVLDGYDNGNMFSVNWGWGGHNNGYFSLDAMNPYGAGDGANGSNQYNFLQGALFGFQRRTKETKKEDNILFIDRPDPAAAKGIEISGLNIPASKGNTFNIRVGAIQNRGINTEFGELQLAMIDHEGLVIQTFIPFGELNKLDMGSSIFLLDSPMQVEIAADVLPGYRICLVYKSRLTGRWVPVTCDEKVGKWEIILNDSTPVPVETKPLDEGTSIKYTKYSNGIYLTIDIIPGTDISLIEKKSGTDYSNLLGHSIENYFELLIKKDNVPPGSYLLRLERGPKNKEIEIKEIELVL